MVSWGLYRSTSNIGNLACFKKKNVYSVFVQYAYYIQYGVIRY